MHKLTIAESEFIGALIETLCFGLYLAFFAASIYVLIARNGHDASRDPVNKTLVISSVVMFLSVAGHWSLDLSRLYSAYIVHGSEPNGPQISFSTLSDTRDLVRNGLITLQVILLDSLLIYRLYHVWGRQIWVTILPTITLAGTLAGGIGLTIEYHHVPWGPYPFASTLGIWIVSSSVFSLVTNLISIAMISWRILRRDRIAARMGPGVGSMSKILIAIVESAAVYCVVNVISLALYVARSSLSLTFFDLVSIMTGISFSMIILRLGLSKRFEHSAKGVAFDRYMPRVHLEVTVRRDPDVSSLDDMTAYTESTTSRSFKPSFQSRQLA